MNPSASFDVTTAPSNKIWKGTVIGLAIVAPFWFAIYTLFVR